MTLLAGLFGIPKDSPRGTQLRQHLRTSLHRPGNGAVIEELDEPDAYLIKADIGAFGEPAIARTSGGATMVAGEPLVTGVARSRVGDTDTLHADLSTGGFDALRRARGTFALAHYNRGAHQLILATDAVGVRPVYWWRSGTEIVFSTALRVLEQATLLPKPLDLAGLAEQVAFGYALATRTAYQSIQRLGPAQYVVISGSGVSRAEYFDWSTIRESSMSPEERSRQVFDAFVDAVRLRLRGDRSTTAFLSGGLDSRAIVGALRRDSVAVRTVNFGEPNTEDQAYAAGLARAAGTHHAELPVKDRYVVNWSQLMADVLDAGSGPVPVERPRLVWSGDGGSVGLGHVYLTPPLVECCASGDREGAMSHLLREVQIQLPPRVFARPVRSTLVDAPRRGVRGELDRVSGESMLQSFYLYIMQNGRFHLRSHFEDIDRHRVEFQLPFFDAAFLAEIIRVPIEDRLYHRFYVDWLANFPSYLLSQRWQAYPGHVPCPVPPSPSLKAQWEPELIASKIASRRRQVLQLVRRLVFAREFPHPLIDRRVLALAAIAFALRVRQLDYVFDAVAGLQLRWDAARRSMKDPMSGARSPG
jgi:asparagine synthase (glutamine-hydrolysing)